MNRSSPRLSSHQTADQYLKLGLSCQEKGEYHKALKLYLYSYNLKSSFLPQSDPQIAISSNLIGLIYFYISDFEKAINWLTKALEIRKNSLPPNDPDLATSYNNLGLIYSAR